MLDLGMTGLPLKGGGLLAVLFVHDVRWASLTEEPTIYPCRFSGGGAERSNVWNNLWPGRGEETLAGGWLRGGDASLAHTCRTRPVASITSLDQVCQRIVEPLVALDAAVWPMPLALAAPSRRVALGNPAVDTAGAPGEENGC